MLSFRASAFFILCVMLCGCSSVPFLQPWSYAPEAPNTVWVPSQKEQLRVDSLSIQAKLQIPPPDEIIGLGDLFDIALHNNPDTARTWAVARQAAADYAKSLSTYFPQVSFNGSYENYKTASVFDGQIFISKAGQIGPEVELSYLLWDFGVRAANAEVYYQTLQNVNWLHNEEIQDVMQSVAASYYDYLYAKELYIADEADLKNAKEAFDAAIEKFHMGIFNETDLMQTKTNYLQKKVILTGQKAKVENSLVHLTTVLGIPANVSIVLGTFPNSSPFTLVSESLDKLVCIATGNRPDLLAAKADILAKEAAVKKAQAEVLPQVNFTGEVGQQWFSGNLTDNGNFDFVFSLTFPIFSGFYYMNQIKSMQAALQKAVANFRDVELDVIQRVKVAHTNYLASRDQLADAKSYLEAADVEFTAMMERYKEGIVTILDLLSSEAFLSDARASYAEAQKNYYMSIINVAYATGMLVTPWNR